MPAPGTPLTRTELNDRLDRGFTIDWRGDLAPDDHVVFYMTEPNGVVHLTYVTPTLWRRMNDQLRGGKQVRVT